MTATPEEHRSLSQRFLNYHPFWLGFVLGFLAVLPKVLMPVGIKIGHEGETWLMNLGPIASMGLVIGVFGFNGEYVYPAIVLGVIGNGLFYMALDGAVRHVMRRVRPPSDSAAPPAQL